MAPSQRDLDRLIRQGEEFARQQAEDARRREGPDDALRAAEEAEFFDLNRPNRPLTPQERAVVDQALRESEAFERRREREEQIQEASLAIDDLEQATDEQLLEAFDEMLASRPEGLPELDDPEALEDFIVEMEQTVTRQEEEAAAQAALPPASDCPQLPGEADALASEIAALAGETDPDAFASKLADLEGRVDAFQSREDECSNQP